MHVRAHTLFDGTESTLYVTMVSSLLDDVFPFVPECHQHAAVLTGIKGMFGLNWSRGRNVVNSCSWLIQVEQFEVTVDIYRMQIIK